LRAGNLVPAVGPPGKYCRAERSPAPSAAGAVCFRPGTGERHHAGTAMATVGTRPLASFATPAGVLQPQGPGDPFRCPVAGTGWMGVGVLGYHCAHGASTETGEPTPSAARYGNAGSQAAGLQW